MKKFTGTVEDFKSKIDRIISNGTWEEFATGIRYRTEDGGVINFYSGTKTIQIQGNVKVKDRLTKLLEEDGFGASPAQTQPSRSSVPEKPTTAKGAGKIFVVHGHDTTSREQLELVLHKLGLEHFVLANSGGEGLTIIESLEKEIGLDGNSKFGIVLLTPDDFGYSKVDGAERVQPRARQNVVLEMGMLISAVGRKNTVMLKKGHLEVPSDASGIMYLPFNDHVKEAVPRLVDRLKASGFDIDPARITNAAS